MIQRTVVQSRRSSIDQRLAGGVGTLGAQYAAVLSSGKRELVSLPRDPQMQKALVDGDKATVRKLAELASQSGLRITVNDAAGTLLTSPRPLPSRKIGQVQIGRPVKVATMRAYVDSGTLIGQAEQPVGDVRLGLATGAQLQLEDNSQPLPQALPLGQPFRLTVGGTRYRAAASNVADSQVVALYP